MFNYLNRGVSTTLAITIVIVLFLLVGGTILGYQYWWLPKQETKAPNIELPQNEEIEKFLGSWMLRKLDSFGQEYVFDLELIQDSSNDGIIGSYCVVALGGSRVDCDPNTKSITGNLLNNRTLKIKFTDSYGGGIGEAIVENNGESLNWEITKKPEGEYYVPDKATLIKEK